VSEQPVQPAPEPPAAPAPPHESIGQRVGDLFHRDGGAPAVRALASDAQPLLHGHVAAVLALGQRVLTDPSLAPLRGDVLALVGSAARLAAISL
jgi:hypothetical protein